MGGAVPNPHTTTSLYVRGAIAQRHGWDAVIERLSPLLRLHVERRLGSRARRVVDPEDILSEAWMIAIEKADQLEPRDGRWTPVLLRFLSTTAGYRISTLERRLDRNASLGATNSSSDPLADLPARDTGILTELEIRDGSEKLMSALRRLAPIDQEILLLRGVEQRTNSEVAERLDLKPSAVAMRYRRACERILAILPDSIVAELED